MSKHVFRVALAGFAALAAAACSPVADSIPPSMKPLSVEAMHLLGSKGMNASAPIYIRIFKEESELEVWKARDDGHFYHFRTYPICNWSGELGPKLASGDRQAPEGFYTVTGGQLNPNSQFHLAFNLGYPNPYDRSLGRTGSAVMVHGNCRSAGCYAMTDALVEEIYALVREALSGGQKSFQVHAFPFRMTPENMKRHKGTKWAAFWKRLKEGYDYFEMTRQPPSVAVCNRSYVVNAKFTDVDARVDPDGPCPAFVRPTPQLFVQAVTAPDPKIAAMSVAPGPKMRTFVATSEALAGSPPVGLTRIPRKIHAVTPAPRVVQPDR